MQVAQSWEQAYRRQVSDIQLREVYSQISQEVNGQRLSFDTTEQFFTRWLANRKIERKHASFQKYSGVLVRFLDSLGAKAKKDIMLVCAADVANYRNQIAARLKPSTANGHLKILRVAFEDAVRIFSNNPAVKSEFTFTNVLSKARGTRSAGMAGKVVNANTNALIENALIRLEGTDRIAQTSVGGRYEIFPLAANKYTVIAIP